MHTYKIFLILIILFLSKPSIQGQIGINFNYNHSDYQTWNEVINTYYGESYPVFEHSYRVGIDYAFESPAYRIRFLPEISYKWAQMEIGQFREINTQLNLVQYAFSFKSFVYPLDLLSKKSMACPSFYRGMDKFTKGWFLSVLPEVAWSVKELQSESTASIQNINHSNACFSFGLGTGLDIGLTRNISLTPTINYSFIIGEKWDGFSVHFDSESYNDGSSASYLSTGIRLGFWF